MSFSVEKLSRFDKNAGSLHHLNMARNFYRKVAFGIAPQQTLPKDPLAWALSQVDTVPDLTWEGDIPTGAEQLDRYGYFVYTRRKVLRPKFKNDRQGYEDAKRQLSFETGQRFFENLELCIRHHTALHSQAPVFERLWHFWCNHFTISDKDFMPEFSTGPYHRETIRPHLTGSFETLLKKVTLSWSMINHLDNSQSVGPNSKSGKWRRKNGKVATVNENHARELLELHTVSPAAGYTQKDVVSLSYVMAGWRTGYSKKRLECNPVKFDQEYHEPGDHKVLGKAYKQRGISPKNKLTDALTDLAAHPNTRAFIAFKLCRHFICDEPTQEMMNPIIKAWEETDGDLPAIHKALIRVVYEHHESEQKFQMPETWLLQMANMTGASWPPTSKQMEYDFKNKPTNMQKRITNMLEDLGHPPYRPKQPIGFPETKVEWLSPELLIRRLVFSKSFVSNRARDLDVEQMVKNNFDNSDEILNQLEDINSSFDKHLHYIFPSSWMLLA